MALPVLRDIEITVRGSAGSVQVAHSDSAAEVRRLVARRRGDPDAPLYQSGPIPLPEGDRVTVTARNLNLYGDVELTVTVDGAPWRRLRCDGPLCAVVLAERLH